MRCIDLLRLAPLLFMLALSHDPGLLDELEEAGLLADDEKPGQARFSRYIEVINRYLWPEEFGDVDEMLARVLRTMSIDEQRALADFLTTTRKPK